MNERIWELAKKAGINLTPAQFSGVLEDEVDEFTLEDFAELLVRECIKSLWTEECHTSDLAVEEYNRNSKKIRQHFGIES